MEKISEHIHIGISDEGRILKQHEFTLNVYKIGIERSGYFRYGLKNISDKEKIEIIGEELKNKFIEFVTKTHTFRIKNKWLYIGSIINP